MANLALNKPATASSYVEPYSPDRAVDGDIKQTSRWVCNQLPGFLSVDLGAQYWINRWVVMNISCAGWPSNYCMSNYYLQVSNDNSNWTTIDMVMNNMLSVTDRSITAIKCQYVRLYVTRGILVNQQLATCMNFEVYEAPPTSANLNNLTLSEGSLLPTFSSSEHSYDALVDYEISSISLTPTAEDIEATIKVNGTIIASGVASLEIPLTVGNNTITTEVTSKIGNVVKTYTVVVVRQSNPYLTGLTIQDTNGGIIVMNPVFSETEDIYMVNTPYDLSSTPNSYAVTFSPSAEDDALIKVNDVTVTSGQISQAISLDIGPNTIPIQVISNEGTVMKEYCIMFTRASNAYLSSILPSRTPLVLVPTFQPYVFHYTVDMTTSSLNQVTIKPAAVDGNAEIQVNNTVISNNTSVSIPLVNGSNTVYISVTSFLGEQTITYYLVIQK